MERKEFLSLLSASTASVLVASCLGSCGSSSKTEDPQPSTTGGSNGTGTGGAKKDFTLDLNQNASLKTKGNAVVSNGVIVAYTNAGTYIAVAAACTHQGTTVDFDSGTTRFTCSAHGSVFNQTGQVVTGPATTALKQYNTTLNGNNLRVYEA